MTSTSQGFSRLQGIWLAMLLAGSAHGSAQADETPAATAATQTVGLAYRETESSFINLHLAITAESAPFVREPDVGGEVLRGKFKLGGSDTNAIAFVWDRGAGKLFLDLNRNLDLTDDESGVFSTRKGYRGNYQSFTNVHLPWPTPSGDRRLAGDLALWGFGRRPAGSFALRSLWQGRMTLRGEEWQIGLIEHDLNRPVSTWATKGAYLLVRPWARHSESFSTYDGSLQAVRFTRQLFLNGQAYDLALTNGPSGESDALQLQFTEQPPALGEVRVTGEFIQRLVLESEQCVVVLDQPEAVVRVPVGDYSEPQVWLQSGAVGAHRESRLHYPHALTSGPKVSISETTPAVLNIGGPLTNSVSVSRRGGSLYLSYQLVGRDGRPYARINQDRTKPPEFAVYHQGRKIKTGKFEFG